MFRMSDELFAIYGTEFEDLEEEESKNSIELVWILLKCELRLGISVLIHIGFFLRRGSCKGLLGKLAVPFLLRLSYLVFVFCDKFCRYRSSKFSRTF